MLFSSIEFLCGFLPFVLLVYYLVPWRLVRNRFLLLMSLGFYAWGEPLYVLLMLACIAGNWLFGLLAERWRGERRGVCLLVAMLVFDLGLLAVFKYAAFAVTTVNSLLGLALAVPQVVLPIGISFFIFQGISYVIDVWRGEAEARRNILDVGLYISFFPQLIAGPIVRYNTIAAEISGRKESWDDFVSGIELFIVGLGKKVLLANNFAIVADKIFDTGGYESISIGAAWVGAIAYTLQIYFDFGGYSDMAIGLGRMFGFHFLPNFNYPYIARSVTDFWRRWHMSLSQWFRDYVYIPLGGNRKGEARMVVNLLVVWLLTGLWHGANWTFVLWGLYYFVFLVFEKLTGLSKTLPKIPVLSNILVMVIVVIGWVLFRAVDIDAAFAYIGAMFGVFGNPLVDETFLFQVSENAVHFVIAVVAAVPVVPWVAGRLSHLGIVPGEGASGRLLGLMRDCVLIVMFLVVLASLAKGSYNPFIYFNF